MQPCVEEEKPPAAGLAWPIPRLIAQPWGIPSEAAWIIAAGLVAAALIIFFFCPRFVLWRALDLPLGWQAPEVNRAVDAWRLVVDPDARIENPLNQVVRWRMLFPLLGHHLRLPRPIYMSLAPVGCIVAIASILIVLRQAGASRMQAFEMAVTLGASGWFFTSMGWLSYMDSWMVVGQLVTTFAPSSWAVAAACALTPWVDERFVLALPLCIVSRTLFFHSEQTGYWPELRRTIPLIAAITAPYVLTRVAWMMSGQDHQASSYLATHLAGEFPIGRYLRGTWHGMRFAWVYVAAVVILLPWKRSPLAASSAVTILIANLFLLHAIVVGDISRTAAAVAPAAIAGASLVWRRLPSLSRMAVPGLMILNLLAPAEHTITTFSIPIRYFYTELDNYARPPQFIRPEFYTDRGVAMLARPPGDPAAGRITPETLAAAAAEFETALMIESGFLPALMHLGKCRLEQGQFTAAIELVRRALQVAPEEPEAHHLLGCISQASGDRLSALHHFQQALSLAPPDWALRSDTQQRLQSLQL